MAHSITLCFEGMTRVAGCLVVTLFAGAAVWAGCRDDLELIASDDELGSDTIDARVELDARVVRDARGSGSDARLDADIVDAPVDSGGGSGSDARIDAGIDAPIDAAIDAAMADAGSIGGPGDAGGGPDSSHGPDVGVLDRTSFYACAGGGCGTATGMELWLPVAFAVGFAIRRRRARPPRA